MSTPTVPTMPATIPGFLADLAETDTLAELYANVVAASETPPDPAGKELALADGVIATLLTMAKYSDNPLVTIHARLVQLWQRAYMQDEGCP